jgi:hypothetical protein
MKKLAASSSTTIWALAERRRCSTRSSRTSGPALPVRRTPGRGAPHQRGPPRAGGRHAPPARPPTLHRSPECGPDAPPPRGDRRRRRRSHQGDGLAPAGIAPPAVPAVPTALEAHERGNGHAATRQSVLARPVIAPYSRRIVDPPRLKFLSPVRLGRSPGNRSGRSCPCRGPGCAPGIRAAATTPASPPATRWWESPHWPPRAGRSTPRTGTTAA